MAILAMSSTGISLGALTGLPVLGTKEAEEAQRTTGETPVGLMGKMPMLRSSLRLDDAPVAVRGPGPAGTKALEVDDLRRDTAGCRG